jgi:ribokinase
LHITHVLCQNEVPLPSTIAYLSVAHSQGITTFFNPSPLPSVRELLPFPWTDVDWLMVNEFEAQALLSTLGLRHTGAASPGSLPASRPIPRLSSSHPPRIVSAYSVLARLYAHPAFSASTNVVCTLGAAGVLVLLPTMTDEPIYVPAAEVKGGVRDTTGAGDCFAGYLVHGLMELYDAGRTIDVSSIKQLLERCVTVCQLLVRAVN